MPVSDMSGICHIGLNEAILHTSKNNFEQTAEIGQCTITMIGILQIYESSEF